jgi:hypothetical protein
LYNSFRFFVFLLISGVRVDGRSYLTMIVR